MQGKMNITVVTIGNDASFQDQSQRDVLQLIKIFSLFLDRNHKIGGSLEWSSVSTKSWHFSKFPSRFFFSLVFSYFQFTTALAITEGSVD